MKQSFNSVFGNLVGEWYLARTVSTGETLTGKAVFKPLSELCLLMHEEGELELQNGTFVHASRDWYWHLPQADQLAITYDKCGLENYHAMEMVARCGRWFGEAKHLCGEDVYSGSYMFSNDGFEINHSVRGPQKNYSLISRYGKFYSK